ncbi:MAG: bifunctional folylpolyglutamate synthase/dihydrofolate synthase [Saprospiraceae bacterium]|nr:bifunctional folylpolyglutamate synthase/dihydrofolate synthase [Saprospiraceae bacterium]
MTYQESLDYMYAQLPMFTRIGSSAFKKDLTNTLALCDALGQPQTKFPTIHVAGTNGKGSTSHLLAAILQSLGLKVGLYVSPHYRDFRERIKINGQYVPKKWVSKFVTQHQNLFTDIQPSFFEMTVAMAFDYFATEGVDIAVVEVGLGGRLDSTNIISPLVSVITNISFDHMDMLGDTLPLIAAEKAGIIKPHTLVVIGEEQDETTPVFLKKAEECQSSIVFASQNFDVQLVESSLENTFFQVHHKKTNKIERLNADLNGAYQAKNIATTLQTVEVMQSLSFFEKYTEGDWQKAVENGFRRLKTLTQFIGRWQVLGQSPTILCDSAHNEAGIKLAMNQLEALTFNRLHFVFGMVRDKDISKVLRLLPTHATYYFCKANIPRGLEADALQNQAQAFGLVGKTYPSVKRALAAAKKQAKPDDLIYIGGSIFVLAEVI